MADITMCTEKLCPNAGICYRVQARPSDWQSMATFNYTVDTNGVKCDHFLPIAKHKAEWADTSPHWEAVRVTGATDAPMHLGTVIIKRAD